TFEVREGIIKHSHDYDAREFPELSEYLLDSKPPLEAQLIDLADEIAYTAADLDDGFESHLIDLEEIRQGVSGFDKFYEEAEKKWPDAIDKLKFNEALKRLLNGFVTDLIENTKANVNAAKVNGVEDVRKWPIRLVSFSPAVEEQRRRAKSFLYEKLYYSPVLDADKRDGERVIKDLFEFWMTTPESLPASYQEKAEDESLPRVICDYIAGMTNTDIFDQHQKYCGRALTAEKAGSAEKK